MAGRKLRRVTFTKQGVLDAAGEIIISATNEIRVCVTHAAITSKGGQATYRLFFGDDPEDGEQNIMERNLAANETGQIDVPGEYELSGHANEPLRVVGGAQGVTVTVEVHSYEEFGESDQNLA